MSDKTKYKYTKDHEWLDVSGSSAKIGITHFAQAELGDLVFVDLPEVGKEVKAGETLCVVESTKAASDVYAPVSGKVVEVNVALKDQPELVNQDPYAGGWLVKIENLDSTQVNSLMSETDYKSHIGE